MKGKPNIDAFLDGGAADAADKVEPKKVVKKSATKTPQLPARVYREQKIFRLPTDLIDVLKRESYERSMESGTRITETELVEQALKAFFKI
jgi:hypothetical protein